MNAALLSPILRFAAVVLIALLASMQVASAQNCSASAEPIIIGPVDVLGSGSSTGVGKIVISCGNLLALLSSIEISIHMGTGNAVTNSGEGRYMTSLTTGTQLSYELYQDPGHQTVFGGDYYFNRGAPWHTAGSSLLELLSNKKMDVPIYARVSDEQSGATPGNYISEFIRDPADLHISYKTCGLLSGCSTKAMHTSFSVQATVVPDCLVTADDLDFGSVGLLDQNVEATSRIHVTCTAGTSHQIGIGYGLGGGEAPNRHMRSSTGHAVTYELYQDANHETIWGLIAEGLDMTETGVGTEQTYTVYGKVPAQPTPPPGQYTDHVVVSVTY